MLSALIVFIILIALTIWLGQYLYAQHKGTDLKVFRMLIPYHFGIALVYYLYALFNRSDSQGYYIKVNINYRGDSWFDFYGVSTTFIEFIGYPFIKYLGFSYEAIMILFAWFGLLGFYFFYIVLKERLTYRHTFFGFDLLMLVLFLPNLHFWSSSFGKGSVIFLGFGLYFYALNKINKRWMAGLLGAMIIYHVRPHILFVVLVASALGFIFSSRGVSLSVRIVVILATVGAFYYILEDVLALTGIDEEELFEQSTTLSHRAYELSKSGSGVDIAGYSFPMKLFTFWFRPLFVDAPGALGLIVSFENLFYLIIFSRIIRTDFISFLRKSDHVVKAALVSFLGVSAALAQVSGNLGIAMRQKSQVMILMMFVILKYLDEKKLWTAKLNEQREKLRAKQAEIIQRRRQGRTSGVRQ